MRAEPPARFITIRFSHYCEKVRWAMDHRGFAYREEPHTPGFHRLATRSLGAHGTVPVLLSDGRMLDDSTAILLYVDEHGRRGQPLLPAEEPARADCLAWESRFDKELGPHTRRLCYYHLLPERDVVLQLMRGAGAAWERAALPWIFPVLRLGMRRGMHIDAAGAQRSRQKIDTLFADIAKHLESGQRYLVGDRFTAADLTFAALAAPVLFPKEYVPGMVELRALPSFPKALADLIE